MIITKKYARRLIKQGKARVVTVVVHPDEFGQVYIAIDRLDLHRTDHYLDKTVIHNPYA